MGVGPQVSEGQDAGGRSGRMCFVGVRQQARGAEQDAGREQPDEWSIHCTATFQWLEVSMAGPAALGLGWMRRIARFLHSWRD
jgi:hypothetical protein